MSGPDAAPAASVPSLRIEPLGCTLNVPAGRSLLEAARDAGIALRASCRNGTCRACVARLLDGRVRYRVEWPGLLREEQAEGLILPCVALPETDVVVWQDKLERLP